MVFILDNAVKNIEMSKISLVYLFFVKCFNKQLIIWSSELIICFINSL